MKAPQSKFSDKKKFPLALGSFSKGESCRAAFDWVMRSISEQPHLLNIFDCDQALQFPSLFKEGYTNHKVTVTVSSSCADEMSNMKFVGNKAKGRISKRVFEKN